MNDTEIECSWLCLKMLLKRDLLTDILEILFLVLALMPIPWNSNVYRESQEEKRPVRGAVALCYVSQRPRKIIGTENSPSHLCWCRGRHAFSAKGSFLGRGQILTTRGVTEAWGWVYLPQTNSECAGFEEWVQRIALDHSSFWFFYTDAQNLELPLQRGGQRPVGAGLWTGARMILWNCVKGGLKRGNQVHGYWGPHIFPWKIQT